MILYHGTKNPLPEDLKCLKFDRERSTDGNAEGPGWYWTTSLKGAGSYAGDSGFIYQMSLCPTAKVMKESSKVSLAKLKKVASKASSEDVEQWITNFGYEPNKNLVEKILRENYSMGTLQEGFLMLYHDLFRWDAQKFIESLKGTSDALIVNRGDENHVVVYNTDKVLGITRL